MSVTVFFIMWDSIHKRDTSHQNTHLETIKPGERVASIRAANQFTVDCGKSTTGLFFGILVLLMTIISLITYFIYKTNNPFISVILSEVTEFCLLTMSLITTVSIYFKLKLNKFKSRHESGLDYNSILAILGLAGKKL
jgi:hypothetical protein